jgi:hypothetical protein
MRVSYPNLRALALSKDRERRAQWQHAAELLAQANIVDLRKQITGAVLECQTRRGG